MAFSAMAVFAAPEPLVGTWRLESQEVNGQKIHCRAAHAEGDPIRR